MSPEEFAKKYELDEEWIRALVNAAQKCLVERWPEAALRGMIRYNNISNIPVSFGEIMFTSDATANIKKIVEQGWYHDDVSIHCGDGKIVIVAPNGLRARIEVYYDIPSEDNLTKEEWLRYQAIVKIAEKLCKEKGEEEQKEEESDP